MCVDVATEKPTAFEDIVFEFCLQLSLGSKEDGVPGGPSGT